MEAISNSTSAVLIYLFILPGPRGSCMNVPSGVMGAKAGDSMVSVQVSWTPASRLAWGAAMGGKTACSPSVSSFSLGDFASFESPHSVIVNLRHHKLATWPFAVSSLGLTLFCFYTCSIIPWRHPRLRSLSNLHARIPSMPFAPVSRPTDDICPPTPSPSTRVLYG
ncbi:hypothetical protein BJY52DRAFT_1346485 [Lactarius psammicola]|nr:hypothetical protein BJY52DRAFT_1346485 [Lactarius psammicola]